jgi:hypothetical protein
MAPIIPDPRRIKSFRTEAAFAAWMKANLSDKPVRMILTFTPGGIEKFFEETLECAHDLTQDCPNNLAEVGARYAEAAARYGMQFFLDA